MAPTPNATLETLQVEVKEGFRFVHREFEHWRELREKDDRALSVQAKEYERRLEDLNHEASRILAANAANVSREVFDKTIGDLNRRVDENKNEILGRLTVTVKERLEQFDAIRVEIAALREYRSNQEGRATIMAVAGSAIISIIVGTIMAAIGIGVSVFLRGA